MYNIVLTQLVRFMTVLAIGALLFTSSMLMNVIYGIMTGIGTIDRLKKKASQTIMESEEEPIPLVHIFGMNPYYTWILPIDPIFPNYDTVMGYSTPQRLLREQMRMNTPIPVVSATNPHPHNNNHHHPATTTTNSDTPPYNNNYNHNNEQYTWCSYSANVQMKKNLLPTIVEGGKGNSFQTNCGGFNRDFFFK